MSSALPMTITFVIAVGIGVVLGEWYIRNN